MLILAVLLFGSVLSASSLPVNGSWEKVVRRRRDIANCQPPNDIDQLFRNLNANIDTSMYLRVARDGLYPTRLPDDFSIRHEGQDSYGSQTCPSSVSDDPRDPLWMRSLCPWYYNVTELPQGHYPRVIPQAICKCQNCIENNLNQCERVTTNIRVLEQTGCQDGFFTYKPKTIPQHVGCTCAKRRRATAEVVTHAQSQNAPASSDDSPSPCAWGCAT